VRLALRVEDLLVLLLAALLWMVGAVGSFLRGVTLEREGWWTLVSVLTPLAVLVFAASLGYARGRAPLAVTLRQEAGALRDWLPFLAFLTAYGSLRSHLWQQVLPHDRDAALLLWDRRLVGETPAVRMQAWSAEWVANAMALAYLLHFVLPPLVAFLAYRRDRGLFRRFMLAFMVLSVLGTLTYLLVPATGPHVAFPGLFDRPLPGTIAPGVVVALDAARAPRDAFPSLHVGISTLVLWYGLRLGRWRFLLTPLVLANWVSTMYLRYHYLVDVFAGWAVALLSVAIAAWLLEREVRWRQPASPRSA